MDYIRDHPLLVLALSLVGMYVSAWLGTRLNVSQLATDERIRADFGVVQAATLTLLGLIIGFTFSMALGRYDQRKNYEEEEANAIGTEYLRADFLPAADAVRVRGLLRDYLDQRVLFYTVKNAERLQQVNARTAKLQADLWSAVAGYGQAQPTPVAALVLNGMNDVLNTQGYTQAAWWNRIPMAAWILMIAMALCSNVLVGLGVSRTRSGYLLILVLPAVAAIAFFLIADIDSPRGGLIRVVPQNLLSLVPSMHGP